MSHQGIAYKIAGFYLQNTTIQILLKPILNLNGSDTSLPCDWLESFKISAIE